MTSAMTSDAEIARNPHQPEGWWRDGIDFFVANLTPSRSPQTSCYSWDETLDQEGVGESFLADCGLWTVARMQNLFVSQGKHFGENALHERFIGSPG